MMDADAEVILDQEDEEDEVVLYPLRSPDQASTVLRVARVPAGQLDDSKVQHFAGGPYKGIIVSKASQDLPTKDRPEAVRVFLAYVQDVSTGSPSKQVKEKRTVRLWFKEGINEKETLTEDFFKTLINPEDFPKDYISFVKKLIVLAKCYPEICMLELEISSGKKSKNSPLKSSEAGVVEMRQKNQRNTESDNLNLSDTSDKKRSAPLPPPRAKSTPKKTTNNKEDQNVPVNNNNDTTQGLDEMVTPPTSPGRTQEDIWRIEDQRQSAGGLYPNSQHASWASNPDSPQKTLQELQELKRQLNEGTGNTKSSVHRAEDTLKDVDESPPPEEKRLLTDEELSAYRIKVLNILEDVFPNTLKAPEIADATELDLLNTTIILSNLSMKGIAQELSSGHWIRVSTIRRRPKSESRQSAGSYSGIRSSYGTSLSQHEFQVVPQMPILPDTEQPRVAVITLLYCEKMAVDAMMEKKTTYVRYKVEGTGESQVYTLGTIGQHRVVSTKLARVGSGQGAVISSGNTVTRLLGTFGKVEHVFLVGVGGSVPNFQTDQQHVRRGDVVLSKAEYPGGPTYVCVTDATPDESGGVNLGTEFWESANNDIGEIISGLGNGYGPHSMINSSLSQYMQGAMSELGGHEMNFSRPPQESDHLYKMDTDGAWVEVQHPEPQKDSSRLSYPNRPIMHFGCVGAGYDNLVKGVADWRSDFALFNNIKAMDSGFQTVMESIDGNRTHSFWIIRGIVDYMDGMAGAEWQPYASLGAAAAMKIILTRLSGTRI